MSLRIALVGNPNSGKTTLFNDLTGANQYVGNWPGVTVEKKEGRYRKDKDVIVTDLPGVYSLSPYSPEEMVTRNFLMSGQPDVVVNIIDATNLERNLYLTTQVLDLGIPVILALNMMDLIERQGDRIDVAEISRELGCPVVQISALKGRNVDELMQEAMRLAQTSASPACSLRFDKKVEEAINQVMGIIQNAVPKRELRWYAIKLLEGEEASLERLNLASEKLSKIANIREALEREEDDDAESVIANERYDAITLLCGDAVHRTTGGLTTTQKIDKAITNRVFGIPIFIAIMFLVYYLAVSVGGGIVTDWANDGISGDGWLYTGVEAYEEAVADWEGNVAIADAYEAAMGEGAEAGSTIYADLESEEGLSEMIPITFEEYEEAASLSEEEPDPSSGEYGLWIPGLSPIVSEWLESMDAAPWVMSLVVDGIIAGVGAVTGFVPQLIILFLLLSFLEGCGYMARVAFVMDRAFRRFGLSGKSFIPMLIASGCGVPAIMATKTIESERDRRLTIMTTTMIPCGAKLPIIALVFGALAGSDYESTWWVAPLFYFLGLAAIILSCIMLKKLKPFSGEVAPFIMELPSYHLPTIKSMLLSMWERVRSYLVKAGTIIFLSTIVIWFLMSFGVYEGAFGLLDPEMDGYLNFSLMAGLGSLLSWIFAPLGFGSWEATVTSVTGLVAKENVVATVGVLTSLGDAGEADPSLWEGFAIMLGGSSAAIMAFCAFNLLCAPCFAAIGAIRRQMASPRWTWAAIGYMCAFGWCVGLLIYQLGGLLAGEVAFSFFTIVAIVVLVAMLFLLFRPTPKYGAADSRQARMGAEAA